MESEHPLPISPVGGVSHHSLHLDRSKIDQYQSAKVCITLYTLSPIKKNPATGWGHFFSLLSAEASCSVLPASKRAAGQAESCPVPPYLSRCPSFYCSVRRVHHQIRVWVCVQVSKMHYIHVKYELAQASVLSISADCADNGCCTRLYTWCF